MKRRSAREETRGEVRHERSRAPQVVMATLGLAAFALYLRTLAPSIGYSDSGELTVAAATFGVPHPPGFPLYVLLTYPFTHLPLGTVAHRANIAAAVFAALAVLAIVPLTFKVLRFSGKTAPADGNATVAAIAAAWLFATFKTPWAYSTVAEVYTLAICLALAIWLLVWHQRLRIAALVYGVAMGVHPAINLAALPALGVFAYHTRSKDFFRSRELILLTLLALAGLSIYGLVPVAAVRDPSLNWGDPSTIERLWAHVSGSQYRTDVQVGLDGVRRALRTFAAILSDEVNGGFAPAVLVVSGIGAIAAYRRHRTAFWILSAWAASNIAISVVMNAGWPSSDGPSSMAEDLDAYYLPTFVVVAMFSGIGVASLVRRNRAFAVVALAIVALPLVANWSINNRSADTVARTYARDVLASIAPGGLLLIRDWNLSSPVMYAQMIERERPDVIAIDLTLLERRWYAVEVERKQAALFADSANALTAYLDRLSMWESDPAALRREPARAREIESAFNNLVLSLLTSRLTAHQVYATREVTLSVDGRGKALARELDASFQFVPQGLVFELRQDKQFSEPNHGAYSMEAVADAERRLGPSHVVALRIAPTYREMMLNRGLYLANHGRCAQAASALQLSLQHDSTKARAQSALDKCR